MSQRLKILLVSNSVPLPDTDFLKHKFSGLSKLFDLQLACWDSEQHKYEFCRKYNASPQQIHLFYHKWNTLTFLQLLINNISRIIFKPLVSIPLLSKIWKQYAGNGKEIFIRFSLYYPIVAIKPDIIHFEYGTLAHSFSDIKKYIDCKFIASFRGYDINYIGLEDDNYYEDVWQAADGIHFLGNDLKQRAMKRGYKEIANEALISPAIDTSFFKANNNVLKADKFTIVSVGRLTWKKGYEYGLQAVAMLKEKGIPFEYRIIADGNYTQPLSFIISELGLENEVTITGNKTAEEIKEELSRAHVMLHPAISEGFSNAVLEGQAMGLPVVATNADGLSENVADGVTGFIVPIFDVTAMAEKLEWCYHHPDKAIQIGMAGIERVNYNFTTEEQIKKFAAFYQQVYAS